MSGVPYGTRLHAIWIKSELSIKDFAQQLGKSTKWVLDCFRFYTAGRNEYPCCNDTTHLEACVSYYTRTK